MATYTNPKGSSPVTFNGRVAFTQQELADACRMWGPRLHVPETIDGARLLWAFAGKESSFGTDCRPRHEAAYCTGKYSTHTDVVQPTKQWGHAAHCSFGPWQILYVNDDARPNPELYGGLDYAALATVNFFNHEIFGRQKAKTIEQAADAWNSGNFRDKIVPADYIASIVHNYNNVPMPAAITIHASGGADANSLYHDLIGAIERLGPGLHMGALVDVPVLLNVDGRIRTVSGSSVQVTNDEHGARVDNITLTAAS